MSRKTFVQISVLALLLLAFLANPAVAQAGGVCGGTYIVDSGDTLNSIAAKCGTSVSAITTANPGVSDPLRAGQALKLPSSSPAGNTITVSVVSSEPNNYNTYTPYVPPITYTNGTYIVRYGDTFSAIASRYGLSINQLWAANPQIWNINYLYAGQTIYIPTTGGHTAYDPNAELKPLSYGDVPAGTSYSTVKLINRSSSKEIYVSLQGTTRDGIRVIYEYPVKGSLNVKVPTGDYTYVAWANGQEFVGYFHLGQGGRTLTFRNDNASAE